ncbi:LAFA_0E15368g1_1 [Lachancea sp. 'fantastica']|nr:LAFA_0E15368g1_1 [Lachancea sp. 'fantastica']
MRFASLGTAFLGGLSFALGHRNDLEDPDEELSHYMGPEEAARVARGMAAFERTLHANTIDRYSGSPVSFIEYFVGSDACHGFETSNNGSIILLLLNMSSTFQNWQNDSKFSVSIEGTRHWEMHKPAMASPRANYFGELKALEPSKALEHCFLKRHPDARWWIPGGKHDQVHDGQWFEFDVSEVHFIGGFGNSAYIGPISGEDYHGAFNHSAPRHPPHHPPHSSLEEELEDSGNPEKFEFTHHGPEGRKILSPSFLDHDEAYFQATDDTKELPINAEDDHTDTSRKMHNRKKTNPRKKCGSMKIALDFSP